MALQKVKDRLFDPPIIEDFPPIIDRIPPIIDDFNWKERENKLGQLLREAEYEQLGGTKLKIVHPSDAVNSFYYKQVRGAIDVIELAPFGRFQTGTSIQAPLYYPPQGEDGCSEMKPPKDVEDHVNMQWNGFVILKDGGCTYEEKARNVEQMGGQALIVAQDETAVIESRAGSQAETSYDGSGTSISIPTIVVNGDDGQKLIDLLHGKPNFDESVVLKADIEISDKDWQRISYSLFYGSIVDLDPSLILRLYEYQHALGDKAMFIPRIMTFECNLCPQEIKEQHCISDGSFCFTPPSDEKTALFPKLTDQQLIKENLRELCIYDKIGDLRDEWDLHIFFNYLYNMHFYCLNRESEITDWCAEHVMKTLQIDSDQIKSCMRDSFYDVEDWDSYNVLLFRDREHAQDLGVTLNPSLAINSKLYDGPLKGEEIFKAICGSYKPGHAPEVCSPEFDIQEAIGHMNDFVPPMGFHHWFLAGVIILVILFNLFLVAWCIRRKKKESQDEIQSQVQMQVEKYFRLQNNETQF